VAVGLRQHFKMMRTMYTVPCTTYPEQGNSYRNVIKLQI